MRTTKYRSNQSTWSLIRKYSLASLALFVQLFFSNPSLAASRIFVDDFEGSISSTWSKDDYRNMCKSINTAADGGRPQSGNQMLRCNWNGIVAWNDPASFEALVLPNWDYNKEFLLRTWIRRDNNSADHPNNGPKIFRIGKDLRSMCAVNFASGQPNCHFGSASGQIGSTYWGGDSNLGDGAWHKVEIYIKDSATDGVIRLWEDGRKLWEVVNVNTTQDKGSWANFYISSNWSGAAGCCDHDTTNYIYWDKFEIYSDIGTGAVGSLSNATISVSGIAPPNPPVLE